MNATGTACSNTIRARFRTQVALSAALLPSGSNMLPTSPNARIQVWQTSTEPSESVQISTRRLVNRLQLLVSVVSPLLHPVPLLHPAPWLR